MPDIAPVPFDPEIAPALEALPSPQDLTIAGIPDARRQPSVLPAPPPIEELIAGLQIDAVELRVPGMPSLGSQLAPRRVPIPDQVESLVAPDVELTVITPRRRPGAGRDNRAPAILYNVHGGGMLFGHRSLDNPLLVTLVEALGVIAVNVEYRLAPEHPYPAAVLDCYAGLTWLGRHAAEIGGDPDRIVVMGSSAGGGLAAAMTLVARDFGGPALAGQFLLSPMLDDRNTTVSSMQYDGIGTWQRQANVVAWRAVLGQSDDAPADRATEDVPIYAAPARATDLANLPPAFIEVGSADLFRDENTAYATRIWTAGGAAELHVWSGAYHGFDALAPDSEVAQAARASRLSWFARILRAQ